MKNINERELAIRIKRSEGGREREGGKEGMRHIGKERERERGRREKTRGNQA